MLRKQMGHLIVVSLKFFFDLDPAFSSHLFFTGFLLTGFFKLFMWWVADAVQDGLHTVKEDSLNIRAGMLTLRNRWDSSPLRESLVSNARSFKNNFSEMDIRGWRLK